MSSRTTHHSYSSPRSRSSRCSLRQQRRARLRIRRCAPSPSNRAIGAPGATRKSSGSVPRISRRWPDQVRCFEFGRTPEGRPMLALVASADGVLDAAAGASRAAADRAHAGRHPCRRDRRQGRRLARAARDARRHGGAGRARRGHVRVRAGVQRRRPRALRALEPAEPGRAARRWAGARPRRTSTSTATT